MVVDLVRGRWFLSTLLLWTAFAANLAAFYAIQSWLPTIVGSLGAPSRVVIASTVLTTIGGILAAIIIGPAMDKINPSALSALSISAVRPLSPHWGGSSAAAAPGRFSELHSWRERA